MEQHIGIDAQRSEAAQADFGAALQSAASRLGDTWRRLHFRGDPRKADVTALLEGVAEPLLFEIGRQLSSGRPSPTEPWSRAGGVLRLSATRGVEALDEEFELLRLVAEGFAEKMGAALGVRRRVRTMVESARLLARAELEHVLDAARPSPEIRFGGVIVELYEPRVRH